MYINHTPYTISHIHHNSTPIQLLVYNIKPLDSEILINPIDPSFTGGVKTVSSLTSQSSAYLITISQAWPVIKRHTHHTLEVCVRERGGREIGTTHEIQ